MIPKECKRLAEVDFPIAVVSKHSAREKSIRHGHASIRPFARRRQAPNKPAAVSSWAAGRSIQFTKAG